MKKKYIYKRKSVYQFVRRGFFFPDLLFQEKIVCENAKCRTREKANTSVANLYKLKIYLDTLAYTAPPHLSHLHVQKNFQPLAYEEEEEEMATVTETKADCYWC